MVGHVQASSGAGLRTAAFAGTTPVVFTIDDSSKGQFYYLPSGEIDPNTMVGSWAAVMTSAPSRRCRPIGTRRFRPT